MNEEEKKKQTKKLISSIPTCKEEVFKYDLSWAMIDVTAEPLITARTHGLEACSGLRGRREGERIGVLILRSVVRFLSKKAV